MPIYEYKCNGCGEVFEFFISASYDAKTLVCPGCGSSDLERLISAPVALRNTDRSGTTCCGREERCEKPPCSTGGQCRRH